MTHLKGKTVLIGLSGGIAAYKVCELVRRLVEHKADVHVVMTDHAREFVTPLTFQTLSGNPVHTNLFTRWGHNTFPEKSFVSPFIDHISLADKADVILVAPATANILAKIAHGICDDLLSTIICATKAPIIFAPSMNQNMWENRVTQDNAKRLNSLGYTVLEPASGMLVCGYKGKGRLPETDELLSAIEKTLSPSPFLSLRGRGKRRGGSTP